MPIEPNFAHASRKVREELFELSLVEIFAGYAGDKDRVGLLSRRVLWIDEEAVTGADEMIHFLFYIPQSPNWQKS